MATIRKVLRASGRAWRADIRRSGMPHASKTFRLRAEATAWTARMDRNPEAIRALGGQHKDLTLAAVCDAFAAQYTGKARGFKALKFDFTTDPLRELPPIKVKNERRRYLDGEERRRLLAACRASPWDRLWLLTALALTSGERQGELLGLRWRDLNLSDTSAFVAVTKNGSARNLQLVDQVIDEIKALPNPIDQNQLLFPGRRPGRPKTVYRPFLEAMERAGIENFRFHDLRHTAASYRTTTFPMEINHD